MTMKWRPAALLLLAANACVAAAMAGVYLLGKDSPASWLLVYGPISALGVVCVRDGTPWVFLCSQWLAVLHGLAHVVWPFLDEQVGVNRSVDVWQDQVLHLCQAVLVWSMFRNRATQLLIAGNVVNVALAFWCWGRWCHDAYVWVSLAPSLASGLHHAAGALFLSKRKVAVAGFALQGASSVLTYFLFRSSDDTLKLFARCRFFELYFIAPHYVGYFASRWKTNRTVAQILGIERGSRIPAYMEPVRPFTPPIKRTYSGDDE